MYGTEASVTGAGVLAVTGALATGAYILAGIGLILAGLAIYALAKRNPRDPKKRP